MKEFWLILGMMVVTFGVRYPVLALVGKIELSPWVLRALGYVPAAVLTAIIIPAMLMPGGDGLNLSLTNTYLIAGIGAGLVSWRTRSLTLTILAGMAAFFVLSLIV